VRIIAGNLRGRRLQAPPPGSQAIRPTSDRAREALFSILGRWPTGPFLDLFSGTGAVALEAWSRGFEPVRALESAPGALTVLRANARGTEVDILAKDARRLGQGDFAGQAVVFMDPPYAEAPDWWAFLAPRVLGWIRESGVWVVETDQRTRLAPAPGWEEVLQRRYGAALLRFYEPRRNGP
jgi:16S rRNA (guanine966-N2)-methyltransferase